MIKHLWSGAPPPYSTNSNTLPDKPEQPTSSNLRKLWLFVLKCISRRNKIKKWKLTIHPASIIGTQESHNFSNIFHLTDPPQWGPLGNDFLNFLHTPRSLGTRDVLPRGFNSLFFLLAQYRSTLWVRAQEPRSYFGSLLWQQLLRQLQALYYSYRT